MSITGNDSQPDRPADPSAVIAIDVLLEPDETMQARAEADNARLLRAFPQGFALDAEHHPHVTLLQRFVHTADLDAIHAAVDEVFADTDLGAVELEAYRHSYIAGGAVGLADIVIRPHPVLSTLQQRLIDAVAPFAVATGGTDAFASTSGDPAFDSMLIDYVASFVPASTGEYFSPHVTIGLAQCDDLDRMTAEPFEPFTFTPVTAAVHQLGRFGTAAKKLHECRRPGTPT